jgi:uncharacterized protein YrrD
MPGTGTLYAALRLALRQRERGITMIGSTNALRGWRVVGRDGELGTLQDFYFDDERWAIRYVIVRTGGWLRGRDVLLSPVFSGPINDWDGAFHMEITRSQIERAPDIDTRKPVSRQLEAQYGAHYDYPPYWAYGVGGALWGWGPLPTSRIESSVREDMVAREMREREARQENGADAHLRSAREVIGYHVEAQDGPIGHIEDLLFDEDSWAIRYVVMNTRNWLPGKHVVISPQRFTEPSWSERKIWVDLTREQIRHSTEFDALRLQQRSEMRHALSRSDNDDLSRSDDDARSR